MLFKNNNENNKNILKYCNKETHKEIYKKLYNIYVEQLTDNYVYKLCHENDSQKCESFHVILSIFLPKYKYYCSTIVGKGRTYLVVLIHSIGWENAIINLF